MNKRLHIYFDETQIETLKAYANKEQVSVSSLLRSLVGGCDRIRTYRPDGKHTAEARLDTSITNILQRVVQ